MRNVVLRGFVAGACLLLVAAGAAAQEWRTFDEGLCKKAHDAKYCESREIILPANRDVIAIDAEPNGGIRVEAWERDEIRLVAHVRVRERSEQRAREVADEIEISTGRTIRVDGPSQGRNPQWSVSFELMVPRQSNLSLKTVNGGIAILDVLGDIDFRATNGGIRLSGLAGEVRGRTINGGLDIELTGQEWTGAGLDVATTNGRISIRVPEDYSAELTTGTVNGRIDIDFPVTVSGRIGKRIHTELGDGGAPVRATTTNGSVHLQRG